MTTTITMSLRLGAQVERVKVREHNHERYKAVEGGATFASLFPELVGEVVVLTNHAVEMIDRPGMVAAVGWLSANGYFTRGGMQR